MKQLSPNEVAFLKEIQDTISDVAAAETERVLSGALVRFSNMDPKEEEVVRALAQSWGVELPC